MSYPTLFSAEEAEEIKSRNESGEFMWALAREYGVSVDTIKRSIVRAGGTPIKHKQLGAKPTISPELQKQMAQEYENGSTIDQLCRNHDLGRKAVRGALLRQGVSLRATGIGPRQFSEEEKDLVVAKYLSGMSTTDIGKELTISQPKVAKIVRERGIAIRTTRKDLLGQRWEPRKRLSGQGYVKIKVHPDDPFYPGTGDAGYMLEHRYVMSQHLGRPLARNETVHHIDGDRQNNSLDNLQLRTGRHGNGQAFECLDCGSHNVVAVALKN